MERNLGHSESQLVWDISRTRELCFARLVCAVSPYPVLDDMWQLFERGVQFHNITHHFPLKFAVILI